MAQDIILPLIVVGGVGAIVWWMSQEGDAPVDDTPITGCTDSDANNYDSTATEDDGSCTYDDADSTDENGDDPLDSFDKHSNKSLYPSLGISDLNKPGRESIIGVSNCAQWCLSNATCVAFHHWKSHPDNNTIDKCYYWSGNQNPDDTYDSLEDALGPGDEGKGTGYTVDAYIKKVVSSAESVTMSSFINGIMSFHAF